MKNIHEYVDSGKTIPIIRRSSKKEATEFSSFDGGQEIFLYNCRIVSVETQVGRECVLYFKKASSKGIMCNLDELTGEYSRSISWVSLPKLYTVYEEESQSRILGKFKIKNRK